MPIDRATPFESFNTWGSGFQDFFESRAAETLRPSSRDEFLGHINRSAVAFRMAVHTLLSGAMLAAAFAWPMGRTAALVILAAATVVASALLYRSMSGRVYVRLSLDEGTATLLQSVADALKADATESSLWHLDETTTIMALGFPDGITMAKRNNAPVGVGSPRSLVIQPPVPWVGVGRQRLYFMPDQLLVTDYWGVGAIPYGDLYLQTSPVTLADRGQRPPTVRHVGTTWPHTRKDGGRDRRYSDNPDVPLGAYWQLTLESSSGLREALLFADLERAETLSQAIRELAQIQTTFTRLSPEGDAR